MRVVHSLAGLRDALKAGEPAMFPVVESLFQVEPRHGRTPARLLALQHNGGDEWQWQEYRVKAADLEERRFWVLVADAKARIAAARRGAVL